MLTPTIAVPFTAVKGRQASGAQTTAPKVKSSLARRLADKDKASLAAARCNRIMKQKHEVRKKLAQQRTPALKRSLQSPFPETESVHDTQAFIPLYEDGLNLWLSGVLNTSVGEYRDRASSATGSESSDSGYSGSESSDDGYTGNESEGDDDVSELTDWDMEYDSLDELPGDLFVSQESLSPDELALYEIKVVPRCIIPPEGDYFSLADVVEKVW
ncbi:hypothetical protein BD413DRAFT_610533 [Trametes elegans]|nr:hypothetical protein BD413DRAFT_610533 [Trametes elegans]